jgi:hypothetical protein
VPVTSGCEQNFSNVAGKLGANRLSSHGHNEERAVRIMCLELSDAKVDALVRKAKEIWNIAFPEKFTKVRLAPRADKHYRLKTPSCSALYPEQGPVNEKQFLRRMSADIAKGASADSTAGELCQ